MKQKLFESVGSNQFKLITENVNGMSKESLVKEGLRKVFMNAGDKISYKHLQGVGLGYIKDVTEARKCAIQEARILAKEYGYADNEAQSQFVKEDGEMSDYDRGEYENNGRPPASTSNHGAEEKREVQIAKEIIRLASRVKTGPADGDAGYELGDGIEKLAQELIQMHQGQ